ncbi:MAG: dihydrodipicolinate synthase family protein [Chloroflexota bacterium]|nr:dihydrodipicolinate synthase family protein [Chloroflexota bacterium]
MTTIKMSKELQNPRGVYSIPVTPFKDNGELDIKSLKKCIEFCLEKGAHGIVMPVNASEVSTLTDIERDLVLKEAIKTVSGSVHFVAGVTGNSIEQVTERSRIAQDLGADSIMTMPAVKISSAQYIYDYFGEISKTVGIPLWIQNNDMQGKLVPTKVIIDLINDFENIIYLKEESGFAGHVISEVVEKVGSKCKSIMGGIGGTFLMDEYRRGASGTMPAGHFTDIVVSIWNALDTQKKDKDGNFEINDRARILWESLLPSLNFERRFGVTAYKWVFWKRGIIESPATRLPVTKPFDSSDQLELQKIMDRLSPLMT